MQPDGCLREDARAWRASVRGFHAAAADIGTALPTLLARLLGHLVSELVDLVGPPRLMTSACALSYAWINSGTSPSNRAINMTAISHASLLISSWLAVGQPASSAPGAGSVACDRPVTLQAQPLDGTEYYCSGLRDDGKSAGSSWRICSSIWRSSTWISAAASTTRLTSDAGMITAPLRSA